MYGLINRAIRDMVTTYHGEDTWQRIRERAEVADEVFLSMEAYPDDLTHRLVVAASQELVLSPAEILRAFGEFWVRYTATEGYGELMAIAGDTLPEFLENLDDLHARVGVNFPRLIPPAFDCEQSGPEELELHYHSQRLGLAPMVVGLVEGLGDRFDTEVAVTQTSSRDDGHDHDVFAVKYHDRRTGGGGSCPFSGRGLDGAPSDPG
ncbi:MAG: heme NO-binding domain-containing protein [Synechococcus sp.]